MFEKRDMFFSDNIHAIKDVDKEILHKLMQMRYNNPYVNNVQIDCKKKISPLTQMVSSSCYIWHEANVPGTDFRKD